MEVKSGFLRLAQGLEEGGEAVMGDGDGRVPVENLFKGADGLGKPALCGVEAAEFQQSPGGLGLERRSSLQMREGLQGTGGRLFQQRARPVVFGLARLRMARSELLNLPENAWRCAGCGADDFAKQRKNAVVVDATEDVGARLRLSRKKQHHGGCLGWTIFPEVRFGLQEHAVFYERKAGSGLRDGPEKGNQVEVHLRALGGNVGGAVQGPGRGAGLETHGRLKLRRRGDLREEDRREDKEAERAHGFASVA
jgi:hypothetical protein